MQEQNSSAIKSNKEILDALKECYERVFSTDDGKTILKDIQASGCMFRSSHIPGDSHETAFNEGMRRLALHITDMAKPVSKTPTQNQARR